MSPKYTKALNWLLGWILDVKLDPNILDNIPLRLIEKEVQAFLDFHGFDFRDFRFTAVYNSILFSSLLVLLSNLDLRDFCFRGFFWCPHINSLNRGMPV